MPEIDVPDVVPVWQREWEQEQEEKDLPDEHSPLFAWFADYTRKYNKHLRGM